MKPHKTNIVVNKFHFILIYMGVIKRYKKVF
jgi:hypothetical protein